MRAEIEEKNERDRIKFKQMLIASNPQNAKELIAAIDSEEPAPLTDEELEEAAAEGPMSAEQVSQVMDDLRNLGFSFMDA